MNFYFDENIPKSIAKAINELEKSSTNYNVQHTEDAWYRSIPDPELIKNLKKQNGILITNDLRMRKAFCELLRLNDVTVFFIVFQSGASYETRYEMVINKWKIIKKISEKEKRPFLCKIRIRGEPEISR